LATTRLATGVTEVTVRGAVPVARVDTKLRFVVRAPLAVIAPLLVVPDKVGVVIVGEVAKTAKPVPVAAFQLGAALKEPVPVCVSTAIAEEVLPASIAVVPAAD